MSNRTEQIRKIISGSQRKMEKLCEPMEEHINEGMNNQFGVRTWVKKSKTAVEITENSKAIGCEITSKKGEIAETPFDITMKEPDFLSFGIKQSITDNLLTNDDEDTTVEVVERFMSSIAKGLQSAETLVFFNHVFDKVVSARSPVVNPGRLETHALNKMYRDIEKDDWLCGDIVVGTRGWCGIRSYGRDFFDEATTREIETMGLLGYLWTAKVRVMRNDFEHVVGIGKFTAKPFKEEALFNKEAIIHHALEYLLPKEPIRVGYSFVKHSDPMRCKHIFEVRSSIGVKINSFSGLAVVKMVD